MTTPDPAFYAEVTRRSTWTWHIQIFSGDADLWVPMRGCNCWGTRARAERIARRMLFEYETLDEPESFEVRSSPKGQGL